MKWPERLIGDIAAHCSHLSGRKVTEHTVLLAIGFKARSDKGQTLNEVVNELGFTRRYGRAICQLFAISFADFTPRNPNNLPLE